MGLCAAALGPKGQLVGTTWRMDMGDRWGILRRLRRIWRRNYGDDPVIRPGGRVPVRTSPGGTRYVRLVDLLMDDETVKRMMTAARDPRKPRRQCPDCVGAPVVRGRTCRGCYGTGIV